MEISMENGEGIVHEGDGLEEFNRIRAVQRALAQAPLIDGLYVVEVDPPTRDGLLRDLEARSLELVQMALKPHRACPGRARAALSSLRRVVPRILPGVDARWRVPSQNRFALSAHPGPASPPRFRPP